MVTGGIQIKIYPQLSTWRKVKRPSII